MKKIGAEVAVVATSIAVEVDSRNPGFTIDPGPEVNKEGMTAESPQGPNIVSGGINPIQSPTIFSTPPTDIFIDPITTRLRESLGLVRGDGQIAHHNIPAQHKGHPIVELAIKGGYEFDGAMNGTKVVGQAGGHPKYNKRIKRELDGLAGKGLSAEEAKDALVEISDRERDRINEGDNYVRND